MAAEMGSSSAGSKERSNRFVWWFSVLATFLVVMVGAIVAWPERFGFYRKQLWDYLDVFLVPAAVAGAAAWLAWELHKRQRKDEKAQEETALKVENQRAQDEALEAYLDEISRLLTDEKRPLSRARQGDILSTVARARTLIALTRLDRKRKRSVLQFLYESDLLKKGEVVVDLKGANLREADLGLADLSAANLHRADLHRADLSEADLSGANLLSANLREADLSEADLSGADLTNATMTNGQKYEDWLKDRKGRE